MVVGDCELVRDAQMPEKVTGECQTLAYNTIYFILVGAIQNIKKWRKISQKF